MFYQPSSSPIMCLLQAAQVLEWQTNLEKQQRDSECQFSFDSPVDDASASASAEYSSSFEPERSYEEETDRTIKSKHSHNLLEKNRRAQLRTCFEELKEVVPELQGTRSSTSTILDSALVLIERLKAREAEAFAELEHQKCIHAAFVAHVAHLTKKLAGGNSTPSSDDMEVDRSQSPPMYERQYGASYQPATSVKHTRKASLKRLQPPRRTQLFSVSV